MYASAASSALSMGRASAALGTDSAELYDDVQCALELLSHIVTKDFIDYAPQSQAATQQVGSQRWRAVAGKSLTASRLCSS